MKDRTLGIQFTCGVCDHRDTYMFSKQAYEEGVVLIQCHSCKGKHLLADRLGWFDKGEESNLDETVQKALNEKGVFHKFNGGQGKPMDP